MYSEGGPTTPQVDVDKRRYCGNEPVAVKVKLGTLTLRTKYTPAHGRSPGISRLIVGTVVITRRCPAPLESRQGRPSGRYRPRICRDDAAKGPRQSAPQRPLAQTGARELRRIPG